MATPNEQSWICISVISKKFNWANKCIKVGHLKLFNPFWEVCVVNYFVGNIYQKNITFLPTYLTLNCQKGPMETKHIMGVASLHEI